MAEAAQRDHGPARRVAARRRQAGSEAEHIDGRTRNLRSGSGPEPSRQRGETGLHPRRDGIIDFGGGETAGRDPAERSLQGGKTVAEPLLVGNRKHGRLPDRGPGSVELQALAVLEIRGAELRLREEDVQWAEAKPLAADAGEPAGGVVDVETALKAREHTQLVAALDEPPGVAAERVDGEAGRDGALRDRERHACRSRRATPARLAPCPRC